MTFQRIFFKLFQAISGCSEKSSHLFKRIVSFGGIKEHVTDIESKPSSCFIDGLKLIAEGRNLF